LQTKHAPCLDCAGVPYVIYTDNTMALTQRVYPAWAPLPPRAASRWLRFEAEICRSASIVFTFSEFARRSVIADYGCAPERVEAVGAGAKLVLDSDAHGVETLANVRYAVATARRGWLTPDDVANTRDWPELDRLRKRGRRA
jgi:hypothetical protein